MLTKFKRSICLSNIALLIASVTTASKGNCASLLGPPMPLALPPVVTTNRYHLPPFTWDTVTNATGYQFIVRHEGVETQRISTVAPPIVVSNLTADLDNYRFTCVATNAAGASEESDPAPLHWLYVLESDALNGPWKLLATNRFTPSSPSHFVSLSRWDLASVLKPD